MLDSVLAGNELINLFPSHTSSWWPIVEDIFNSPTVRNLCDDLVTAAVNHGECRYLSVDGTFRVCFSLLGQQRFDTPKPLQKDASPGDIAFHRVISIRGCTGAVLGLMPSSDERSTTLADCICKSLSGPGLEQVEHVATDCPSKKLDDDLSVVLPALSGLSLDPTHAAMRYEQATAGRKTAGSVLLRSFMAKFAGYDPAIVHNQWGPMYRGDSGVMLSPPEVTLRGHILGSSMPLRRAKRVINEASKLVVWPTRLQFVEALAALSCVHADEMSRKLEGSKMTVGKSLHALVAPDKLEWLFNGLRYRHLLPPNVRALLPSGTTASEALHAEVNQWFRQIQSMHRSTLVLKLQILRLGKLLAHNVALYTPTSRQMPAAQVLARRLGVSLWTDKTWKAWSMEQKGQGRAPRASLPLAKQRKAEKLAVAGAKKRPASGHRRKRTAFTLERTFGVRRSGVHKRRPASAKTKT